MSVFVQPFRSSLEEIDTAIAYAYELQREWEIEELEADRRIAIVKLTIAEAAALKELYENQKTETLPRGSRNLTRDCED